MRQHPGVPFKEGKGPNEGTCWGSIGQLLCWHLEGGFGFAQGLGFSRALVLGPACWVYLEDLLT